ncbi:alpha/beta fold hydrolase [Demequina sp. NBRC 110052]|uniref:alpha/beta fold hydrolase n=1 Tax=Demequina sp. NBRC 110052 TaxID=1570341 RepID=UPI000A01B7B5|nr:alpha/beta hydrolase [Demequina sp. NBRC 110052]
MTDATIEELHVTTDRLRTRVLERGGPSARRTLVLIHGNVSSADFWRPTMAALDSDIRALAIDLRGFGGSEPRDVDATRGVRDFSDDVAAALDTIGVGRADVVGWSMGGGVAMQLLIDRPELVSSLTLVSPVSPYGFGGTAGADGRRLTADGAGTGGGGANPDFVARLAAGDRTDEAATSPRSVYRASYVVDAATAEGSEDEWVDAMLTTRTGEGAYPGDAVPSEAWPGFAAGSRGVLNTMSPRWFDTSGIVDVDPKPPVLWVHGDQDAIVSDASMFDLNRLGELGIVPGWPGAEVAPAQPMVAQTRAVLDAYAARGGAVRELVLEGCGHSAHLERPDAFRAALAAHLA